MSGKRGLQLDRVVLLGRTFEEYRQYFLLDPEKLAGRRVLDVAGGVGSFCAEANALGIQVTAVDPIYALAPEEIGAQAPQDLDLVIRSVAGLPTYKWQNYRDPEHVRELRGRALESFLRDYPAGRGTRYIIGALPSLPFADRSFDLALASYFLFAYDDKFDYEFHRDSIRELMRVASGEARVYPTVNFEAKRSEHLERMMRDPALGDLRFEIVPTDFEFLLGSNNFLRVTRAGPPRG